MFVSRLIGSSAQRRFKAPLDTLLDCVQHIPAYSTLWCIELILISCWVAVFP